MPESKVKADKAGSGKIVVQLKQTSITWNDESKAQMLSVSNLFIYLYIYIINFRYFLNFIIFILILIFIFIIFHL